MAHIRVAKLVCDKCGAEIEIDPGIEKPFYSNFTVSEQNYSDWGEVKGKHFCGDCFAAYKQLCADFEDMLAERFGLE